ncbi:hypothetical protein [Rhizobium lusitanum]|uniref:Uncharacterized protein n=1 Tax=Rhizobium lusitanum TaxID=293958 RepID=A0A7X0MFH5_9HYPH|nr:hypothetical protein [Rhizobium lusitanum]MBB6487043.1 hypothetical protein [Rhizobium lusitanum]
MRQAHDVVGGVRKSMNDLAENLIALIAANHPPAVILATLMGEAALTFPGLRDVDLMKLIDDLLVTAELQFAHRSKVIRFARSHAVRAATALV